MSEALPSPSFRFDLLHIVDAVHGLQHYPDNFLVLFPVLDQTGADIAVTGLPPLIVAAVEEDAPFLHLGLADATYALRASLGDSLLVGDASDLPILKNSESRG